MLAMYPTESQPRTHYVIFVLVFVSFFVACVPFARRRYTGVCWFLDPAAIEVFVWPCSESSFLASGSSSKVPFLTP
jgi:hypothetical protein